MASKAFEAIRVIDEIAVNLVGDEKMERFLFCMDCLRENGQRRFFSDVGAFFTPRSDIQMCESGFGNGGSGGGAHNLNANQLSLMARENLKAAVLKAFLKEGIKNIKKTTLGELKVPLQRGDQIWIYRDGSTTSCNPVASLMPYAHVAVLVGNNMVVHVAKASPCRNGCMMGTIKKEPISSVINPGDLGKDAGLYLDLIILLFSVSWS